MKLLALFLLLTPCALAQKTLTGITLLPPADGYHITPPSGSIQLAPLCKYSDGSTDNCSTQTLTWGSSDPVDLSVDSSTGLATMGPGQGGAITSIVRASNNVTVTTTTQSTLGIYARIIVAGVTDASFDGSEQINNYPSGNTFTYTQTGPDASSSGGRVFAQNAPDVYAYTGTVLGHHPVLIDYFTPTSLASRPETHDSGPSTTVVVGTTVLVGAMAANSDSSIQLGVGDYCAYTTSDATKATVNNIGEVTGVAPGSVNITCTFDGLSVARSVTVIAPTITNTIWYVRPDGGTRWDAAVPTGQCDGKTNAAYPGSGTDQPCAFSSPMYCLTDETSSTVYTGALQSGDTCLIAKSTVPYNMGGKGPGSTWVAFGNIPSGTPSNHTKILGSNYASCTNPSQETALQLYYAQLLWNLQGSQNVDMECISARNFKDCNSRLTTYVNFPCDGDFAVYDIFSDDFTANVHLENDTLNGFMNAWTGTPGPGITMTNVRTQMNYAAGLNFDVPFGAVGDRTDGFSGVKMDIADNGCTEEVPKTLASVSRDGAGNLTATFNAGQMVNYVANTNLVLSGMTPADLNGTFPVTSVTFNQKTATITGGSCVVNPNSYGGVFTCTFTTSAAPTFGTGEFVDIAGATPSWLNGSYEVYSSDATGFVVIASSITRLGWTTGTISSGGTASTAVTVTASAAGAAESASTLGTASHVIPAHRCLDQGSGGYGDGVGTGSNTIGSWSSDQGTFTDNLQDGWDMLHSAMVSSTFTRNVGTGNEGAPAKFGNADIGIFSDNVMVGNCNVLLAFNPDKPPDFNQYLSYPCRAGDAYPVGTRMWSRITISNNTWESNFPTIIDDACNDAAGCQALPTVSKAAFQNNLFLGFMDSNTPSFNGSLPGIYCGSACNGSPAVNMNWQWLNNFSFNTRNPPAGGTGNHWTTDPLVVTMIPDISTFAGESVALDFNMNLTAPSPAIGAGTQNSDVPSVDNVGYPMSNPPVVGALMFQAGPPAAKTALNGRLTFTGTVTF